ncbi:hypothetical protein C5167_012188 [Papaver somniferum]|uniref:ADP,ATP carrier protein n=1 Tax=Papaver somniferum TaxID=3469 RepID=A0A4Y7IYR0_PAPSO|nr:mitochondrial adenine nucleotide transporter ADNT1-like [Papaver somniferum]RZC53326.1 hypothetical protein C5167_012188 [Papaver somniferum]
MELENSDGRDTVKETVDLIRGKRRKLKKPVGLPPPSPPHQRIRRNRKVSAVALAVSATAVAPLRRLEILLQVQNSTNIKYKDIIQGLKHMRRTDGFRGLFKGNGAYIAYAMSFSTISVVVAHSLARTIWRHWLEQQQQPGKENLKLPILVVPGLRACTLVIAMAATYPMNMVQGRLSVQTGKSPYQYRGIYHALSTIAREEGTRALYKGCLPFTIGLVVQMGVNITVIESFRISTERVVIGRYIESKSKGINPEVHEEMAAIKKKIPYFQDFASAISHTFAYPFNVIHRRMQMGGWKNSSSIVACDGNNKAAIEFTGMCDAFKKTIRNDGFKALYKGFVPNLLMKVLPISIVGSLVHRGLMEGLGVEVNINEP